MAWPRISQIYRDTLIEQTEQGVSYFTIHPCRRFIALHSFDCGTGYRNCFPWRFDYGKMVFVSPQRKLSLHPFEDI
jgi:hypothetical protein